MGKHFGEIMGRDAATHFAAWLLRQSKVRKQIIISLTDLSLLTGAMVVALLVVALPSMGTWPAATYWVLAGGVLLAVVLLHALGVTTGVVTPHTTLDCVALDVRRDVSTVIVDQLVGIEAAKAKVDAVLRNFGGHTFIFVGPTQAVEALQGGDERDSHVASLWAQLSACRAIEGRTSRRMHELQERKEAEGRSRMLEFSLSLFATEEILKAQNAELQQQLDAEREAACELQRRLDERMGVERQARDRVIERMQGELRRGQRQLVQEERTAREARRAHREAVERHSQQMCETASEVEAATTAALATAQRAQEDAERAQAGTLCALARANGEPAALAALPLGELEELEEELALVLAKGLQLAWP